nr:hypothetical protein [Bacillus cereus]
MNYDTFESLILKKLKAGKAEELQKLNGAPYIKAVVRGVTVEKQ